MSRGFTLIEMVISIILLSIVGLFLGNVIGQAMGIYADTSAREALIQQGRFVTERMSRELREAVPNSMLVANGCIEFLPIINSGIYQSFSTTSITEFRLLPIHKAINAGERLVVYPNDPVALRAKIDDSLLPYIGQVAEVGNDVDFTPPLDKKMVNVVLRRNTRFTLQSPASRVYFYKTPVAYCYVGNSIYRYADYSLHRAVLSPAYLGNGVLMAQQLSEANFSVVAPELQRNGLVKIELTFSDKGEQVRFDHDALVYNTP
ncbi:type II secretion system protein [Vibrio mimicus]